jgi:protein involved in polysaccharide export with SLBB domain
VPEYSRKVRLFKDGTFDYYRAGIVQASGLTIDQLRDKILEHVRKHLKRPNVQVALLEIYREPVQPKVAPPVKKITVLGAATKKGILDLPEPKPLRTLLAEIQPTDKADWSRIQVKLPEGGGIRTCDFGQFALTGMSADDITIQGGEEITLLERAAAQPKEAQYVRIGGAVGNPNQYELKPNMTLEDLIISAGKLHPLADYQHVQLSREGNVQTINLAEQRKLGLNGHVHLQGGDVIQVDQYKNTVMVLGAVPQPGPRPVTDGVRIRDFFTVANPDLTGTINKATANLGGFEVIRDKNKPIKVNMSEVYKNAGHKDNIALKSGDMIYVPAREQKSPGLGGMIQSIPAFAFLFGLF